jgi:hypothetical protein
MSRINKVIRELSDLRAFYLKLQKSKQESQRAGTASELVAEERSVYNSKTAGITAKDFGNSS